MCTVRRPEEREELLYERPAGKILNKLNVGLGPLPEAVEFPQPDLLPHKNGKWQRRFWALVLLWLVMTMAVTLIMVSPVFILSPAYFIGEGAYWLVGDVWWTSILKWIVIVALLVVMAIIVRRSPSSHMKQSPYRDKLLDKLALYEEMWFRTGAESWTWRQRIYSCIMFSIVHIPNIVFPLALVVTHTIMGAIFMFVYLSIHRRTGNIYYATLHVTRLHATYNRYALALLVIVLVALNWPS